MSFQIRLVVNNNILYGPSSQTIQINFSSSSDLPHVASITNTAISVLLSTWRLLFTRISPNVPSSSIPGVSIITTGPKGKKLHCFVNRVCGCPFNVRNNSQILTRNSILQHLIYLRFFCRRILYEDGLQMVFHSIPYGCLTSFKLFSFYIIRSKPDM